MGGAPRASRRSFLYGAGATAAAVAAGLPAWAAVRRPFAPLLGAWTSLDNCGLLASAGYGFVEEEVDRFLVPGRDEAAFERNLAAAARQPVPVLSCVRFLPPELQSIGPDANHDGIAAFSEIVFRRARRAGVRYIVFGSPRSRKVPDGFSREAAKAQLVALGRILGPIAQANDVIMVLEPLNQSETNFINRVSEGAEIVRAAGHPHFRLMADLFHMKTEDEGPQSILANGDLLHHAQIAEKQGRRAPGVSNEDFIPYFKALWDVGYAGPLSVECIWSDVQTEAPLASRTISGQIARMVKAG
ncbi:sugar phosphate isomerase/epimerase family protein [Sphingomonas flavalba]|uniref:sugar phosphate isomerase/epimerase family protein n=1 Tax=Sphingomonas flavalba TaxID=2559804 RepID=UPI0039E15F4F